MYREIRKRKLKVKQVNVQRDYAKKAKRKLKVKLMNVQRDHAKKAKRKLKVKLMYVQRDYAWGYRSQRQRTGKQKIIDLVTIIAEKRNQHFQRSSGLLLFFCNISIQQRLCIFSLSFKAKGVAPGARIPKMSFP